MRWSLHSSAPVHAAEIAAHLEGERLHYEKGLLRVFARNLLNDEKPTERQPVHDAVAEQMKATIASAAAASATMGTAESLFYASIYGHVDEDDALGVTERVSISVDIAPALRPEP